MIGKLTALAITQARRLGYYGDGCGLFLQVSDSEAKSWVFRFKEAGKFREMGLSATHTVSLAEARQKALECRKARLDGLNPIDVRRGNRIQAKLDAANAMAYAACAKRYIASHKAGWRNPKHAAQWPATLGTYVYPVFGSLPVQAVDVGLVMKVIEPIWAISPRPQAGCAAGSKAFSIGLRRAAIDRARTRHGGGGISKTSCRKNRRSGTSSTIRRCPMLKSPPSWPSCGSKRGFPHVRSNLRS
jgi:hypothetical protein